MRDKDRQLAQQCDKWVQASRQAEKWILDNRETVGGECDALCKSIRKQARGFRRLSTAASRKMCVGVFGPSQAGKSYLISALARDRNGDLFADFAGQSVDFIRKINPEGGKESTGLVTRFTTTPPQGVTKDKPIRLRLFSEMDLVKVFANTYSADCKHKEAPKVEEVLEALEELQDLKEDAPNGQVTADDVEDLREYVHNRFGDKPRAQLLDRAFWTSAMELAPLLSTENRARLFACIWGGCAQFTGFFLKLSRALEAIGWASEANCPLEALIPREKSIIDVTLLKASAEGSGELLEIEGIQGQTASLERAVVTALTAEISIYMPEKPDDFFDYTDLLDFPGYRSRLNVDDLQGQLKRPDALEGFFLRGKVAYLFERYCDEQELTSMLLCIGPSNQEVQDLPDAINGWIQLTQGRDPEDRQGHAPTLFFILTKMDMEFERKQGAEDVSNRWNNRLAASLTSYFGARHTWPQNWDGKPFRNMFLMRNPNFRCDAIFTFNDEGEETGIREDMQEYVEKVRDSFLYSRDVQSHFPDPQAAWDAAMKLNDGGIELLRTKLAPICDPDRKYNQTRDRSFEAARRMAKTLSAFHRSDDLELLRRQKKEAAMQITREMVQHPVASQQFADLMRRMQVSDYDLYGIASSCVDTTEAKGSASVVGSAIDADDLLGDIFGDAAATQAPEEEQGIEEASPAPAVGRDQISIFCERAMTHWYEKLEDVGRSAVLCRLYALQAKTLETFADEIKQSARHFGLEQSLRDAIREKSSFINITRDVQAWRMASEAAYRINSFVDWLGHDARLGQSDVIVSNGAPVKLFQTQELKFGEHGEPVVPERTQQYDRSYYADWFKAFNECVTANVMSPDDKYDPAQNDRLGDILDVFQQGQAKA
ncbi:MAG: type III effector HopL1 [Desulfovibrio sp.]|nr:type III effector HopL1 [Desulfovibrio sp.]